MILKNDIEKIIIEPQNKNLKLSYIAIYVEGGIVLDSKIGISHIVEHLKFNAVKSGQYLLEAYNIEAIFNAYTSNDCVCYYMTVCHENLFKAIKLIVKVIKKFSISRKKLIEENKIVLQEQFIRNDNPNIWIYNKAMENIFKGHPLENAGLDVPLKVPFYTLEDVKEHVEKFYVAQNMLLVISSNVATNKLKNLKIKGIPSSPLEKCKLYNKPLPFITDYKSKPLYFRYDKVFSKVYIMIMFTIPYVQSTQNAQNPDLKTILIRNILVYILGNKTGISELFNYVRFTKRYVYEIGSEIDSSQYHTCINTVLSVSKNNIDKSIEAIFEVITYIKKGKLKINFNVHKKNFLIWFKDSIDTDNSTLPGILINLYRTYSIVTDYKEILEIYNNITLSDVIKMANDIFIFDSRCSIHITGK